MSLLTSPLLFSCLPHELLVRLDVADVVVHLQLVNRHVDAEVTLLTPSSHFFTSSVAHDSQSRS
eukprot:2021771-Heterocapsa_arctica.AAC.1